MYGDDVAIDGERTFDNYVLVGNLDLFTGLLIVEIVVVDVGVVTLAVESDEILHVLVDLCPCSNNRAVNVFITRGECQSTCYKCDGEDKEFFHNDLILIYQFAHKSTAFFLKSIRRR